MLKKVFFIMIGLIYVQNCAALAQVRPSVAVSIAAFDIIQHNDPSIEGRLELWLDKSNWKFDPFIGIMGNSDNAKHIYFGVFSEFTFLKKFRFSPSFAPGFYFKGKSKDLSYVVEFRSQLEISYRFKNKIKLALSLNHISNASIKPPNLGVESLALTFVLPMY